MDKKDKDLIMWSIDPQCYELMLEIEKLPASEQQTKVCILAGKLSDRCQQDKVTIMELQARNAKLERVIVPDLMSLQNLKKPAVAANCYCPMLKKNCLSHGCMYWLDLSCTSGEKGACPIHTEPSDCDACHLYDVGRCGLVKL